MPSNSNRGLPGGSDRSLTHAHVASLGKSVLSLASLLKTHTETDMNRSTLAAIAAASFAALSMAACGASPAPVGVPLAYSSVAPSPTAYVTEQQPGNLTPAPTGVPIATPVPTAAPTPVPIAPASSGYGDTSANPDSTFACAYSASFNGAIVAYMTIAGSDTAAACAAIVTPWQPVTSIPAGGYLTVAGCFNTPVPGATIRIYTAAAGSVAFTQTICSTFLGSA